MQETQETRLDPCKGKLPWRRKWQPTLIFLPGKSRGQGSLVGYSPWGHRVGRGWATEHTQPGFCTVSFTVLGTLTGVIREQIL